MLVSTDLKYLAPQLSSKQVDSGPPMVANKRGIRVHKEKHLERFSHPVGVVVN